MKREPRILVLTLSFGAGHISAARNVAGELERQMPTADLRLTDALENCSLWFRAFYVWTYWLMIRRAPRLWKKFFNSRIERRDAQTAPVWMWHAGCRKVFAEIEKFQPDLIVAAEVGACEIAVIAKRKNLTRAEIVNVITDYEAEPIWVKPEIACFSVATDSVKKQLANWGADADKIKVCGIPLSASFSEKTDAQKTRARFGLDARPVVLLMGGGMGPSRMSQVAAHLLETSENLQIVALPAKDAKAKTELEKLKNTATVSLRVLAWTDAVAELMRAANVLATKPGGLTLSEAAACGLPLVLFDAIPGPEEENARLFVAQGAAVNTRGAAETASEILRLVADTRRRERMTANARKLARADASEKIAGLILVTLERAAIETVAAEKKFVPNRRLAAYQKMFAAAREIDARKDFSEPKQWPAPKEKPKASFGESSLGLEIK